MSTNNERKLKKFYDDIKLLELSLRTLKKEGVDLKTPIKDASYKDFEGRKKYLPYLIQAMDFITPEMERIETALKKTEFTTDLSLFQEMKRQVPEKWNSAWENLQIKRYLNEKDMKEFSLDI